MDTRKPRIAITHGDTNAIGYELIFKTFAEPQMLELCTPIIYGSPKVASYHRKALGLTTNFSIIDSADKAKEGVLNIVASIEGDVKVELGSPTAESGEAAFTALDIAMTDYREGLYDALVVCPVDDGVIRETHSEYSSMKKYLESSLNNGKKTLAVMVNSCMRIASVAQGIGIMDLAKEIIRENIERRLICLYESLRRDFMLSCPRIAVMSLNHELGKDEQDIIVPAIEELSSSIVGTFGPYTSRQLFGERGYDDFDAILAMYDDQAYTPFKTLTCSAGCKYLAGLPLVCTATTDGTRYDIAGQGKADERSFRRAIYTAIDIFNNRKQYDEPLANPLPKLYNERRDDGEKVRYSVPKRHEESTPEEGKQD